MIARVVLGEQAVALVAFFVAITPRGSAHAFPQAGNERDAQNNDGENCAGHIPSLDTLVATKKARAVRAERPEGLCEAGRVIPRRGGNAFPQPAVRQLQKDRHHQQRETCHHPFPLAEHRSPFSPLVFWSRHLSGALSGTEPKFPVTRGILVSPIH